MSATRESSGAIAVPCVLLVDDDHRVLELLEVAYTAHGFRVLTASDGHEAMQKALTDRPDLLVLDVRLPRKSGLEVCEMLRRDPEEFMVPIILVSAAGETDARIKGLAAGADDFLAKPFSPRELIARSRRLLTRTADVREARQRTQDLERDLAHAQNDVKRSMNETRREQQLREIALRLTAEFQRTLDVDELARSILKEAQSRFGVGTAALLLPDGAQHMLTPCAIRGDGFDRVASLEFPHDGALAHLLVALGRPAMVRELERLPDAAHEMPVLVAARFARAAALCGPEGLEGMLLTDERVDGQEPTRADLEMLVVLCEVAGVALRTARRFRARLDLEVELAVPELVPAEDAREITRLIDQAAQVTLLPPRLRSLVAQALRFPHAGTPAMHDALERIAENDPTGRTAELIRLLAAGDGAEARWGNESPEWTRAAALIEVARAMAKARADGAPPPDALKLALAECGLRLDSATAQALASAAREAEWNAVHPVRTDRDPAAPHPLSA
jgi:DNA-binding response OmpR family regulator